MRIISGTHRRRKITPPKGLPVRPTTDMAKESLFNILNNTYDFEEVTVLDLFSGTGNISFEFASRGARGIVSVDEDHRCVRFISETAKEFDFPIAAVKSDAFAYLTCSTDRFQIIFADPPYDLPFEEFSRIPEIVFRQGLLEPDGLLIVEHSKYTDLSALANFIRQRKYGGSVFSFFEFNE